jgi:hypothetical protein
MVTLLITSFLLIAGITYAIYLWQRPSINVDAELELKPPPSPPTSGLFEDPEATRALALESAKALEAEQRARLLARAMEGDKQALGDAQASDDASLYDEVLNLMVERADSDPKLLALVSHITRSDPPLRVNRRLAEKFIESWKTQPDRNSTAKMLHVAALANDAGLYQTAVEAAYQFWRARDWSQMSPDDLRLLIESEFWILSPDVRSSGAGFVLKRKLAEIRRQLIVNIEKNLKERAPP